MSNLEKWLRENREIVSLSALERRIGCPRHTLLKVVEGRNVPEKWRKSLYEQIINLSLNDDENMGDPIESAAEKAQSLWTKIVVLGALVKAGNVSEYGDYLKAIKDMMGELSEQIDIISKSL